MQGAAAPAAPGGLCKDIVPATHLLGAPPQAPGAFAELVAPAATFWALRPKPRPTFSRRESRQRYARNLLVPGPPAQGGGPPWIPPALCPSGIGGGGTGSAASSGGGAADGAADTLSFIQEKNCWMPGGEYRPYMADRGRLGCSCNESTELS